MVLLTGLLSLLSINSFAPENELWREDCLYCENTTITQALFNKIIAGGRKAYAINASNNKETLTINAKWTDSTVNANCSRYNGKVVVNMYGGLARRPEITPEGFALVLGHELSHAYGGVPYYPNETLSAEGQADYKSTLEAYAKIAAYVPELSTASVDDTFVKHTCSVKYGRFADNRYVNCIHALEGGKSLGKLLALLNDEPVPNYETPDTTIVKKTQTSYPDTVQCRVDSYLNGELNKARPRCWYKP